MLRRIERDFGSEVFEKKWNFLDHLNTFETECKEIEERLAAFYPKGLLVGVDGKPVTYPDRARAKGSKLVTSIPSIVSLLPESSARTRLQVIHGQCRDSLRVSYDDLLQDEMQARYVKIAHSSSTVPGLKFFFFDGICRYRLNNAAKSETLLLTRHDLARALVRDLCKTPASMSFAGSIIDDLFFNSIKPKQVPLTGLVAATERLGEEYGAILNNFPKVIAGRFGMEVVINPESIFQKFYQRTKHDASKLLNTPEFDSRANMEAKSLVRILAEFMVYHHGVLFQDCVDNRLKSVMEHREAILKTTNISTDLYWDLSHFIHDFLPKDKFSASYWNQHLNAVKVKDQQALRAEPPARLLTYAVSFYHDKPSTKGKYKESLYCTTNQLRSIDVYPLPHECAGPGCGPCKNLPWNTELRTDIYPSVDDTEPSLQ